MKIFSENKKIIIFVVAVLAILVFIPKHGAEFLFWDDDLHLTKNPFLNPVYWESFVRIWTTPYPPGPALYIPVTYTLWAGLVFVIQAIFGNEWSVNNVTFPFLALNLLVHFLNTALVYKILSTLLKPASWLALLFGTLIFLFHPLQLESVAWISGFKEMIWVMFALFMILAYLRDWLGLSIFWMVLSILSKPTAVVLPLIILALEWRRKKTNAPRRRNYLASLFLLASPFAILTIFIQPSVLVQTGGSVYFRPVVAFDTIGFYVMKIFWPFQLSPDYGRTPRWVLENFPTAEMGVALLVVLLVSLAIYKYRRTETFVSLGAALFLIPLLPVLGLVPFQFQNFSTVADRYCYFPMLGVSLLCVKSMDLVNKKARKFAFLILLPLISLDVLNGVNWRHNVDFFRHALLTNPRSEAAEVNLGVLLSQQGNDEEALSHFRKAYLLNPGNEAAAVNVGVLLQRLGNDEGALKHYEQVLQQTPQNTEARLGYSVLLKKLGKEDEALKEWNRAKEIDPTNPVFQKK